MDQPISRAEHEEFKRRLDEENARQDKRLALIEESLGQINTIATSVEKLAQSVQSMCKEQEKQGKRLAQLENKDGDMWRKSLVAALTCIIGAIVGYAMSHLGL